MEPGVMGGPAGMHGPGQGMGDSHGMRQGMWGGPGAGQGMHPPHGQGEFLAIGLNNCMVPVGSATIIDLFHFLYPYT